MGELFRDILLLATAAVALTTAASAWAWWNAETRRLRRALRGALGGPADAEVIGLDAAAAVHLATGLAAVAWDKGSRFLVYDLARLEGAELIIDGAVAGRVFRGEARRALDHLPAEAREVGLRLVFDDARDPDFEVVLWRPGEGGHAAASPEPAIQAARSWLARTEAIVRRPVISEP